MATTYVKDGEETQTLPETGGYDVLKDGKVVSSVPNDYPPAEVKGTNYNKFFQDATLKDVPAANIKEMYTLPSVKEALAKGLLGAVKETSTSQTPSELKPKDIEPGTPQVHSETSGPAPTQTIPQPRVKGGGSAGATPAIKEPSYETFTPAEIKNSEPNAGEDTLGKNKDDASKRLADATQALKDSQTVSPGQKLAMALIGLLPALGGGLIGAAIHNPTSAAAGISGGLEGSAKGLESLNKDQKDKISQAQKVVDTEKGNLLAAGKDLLERQLHNKDFARGVGEKNTEEQNKAGEEGSKDRNATKMHTYLEQLTNAKDLQIAREHNAMEERIHNGEKKDKVDAAQRVERTAADNIEAGLKSLDKLEAEVKKNGNTQTWWSSPEHKVLLRQELPAAALALHQSQQLNARSVPGPEVDKLQEERLPAGAFTLQPTTVAAIKNAREDIVNKAQAIVDNSPNPPPTLARLVSEYRRGGGTSPQAPAADHSQFYTPGTVKDVK